MAFPMLPLAYQSARYAGSYPIVYNAVNEVSVDAFVKGKIQFTGIPIITEKVLSKDWTMDAHSFDEVLKIDNKARSIALKTINGRI